MQVTTIGFHPEQIIKAKQHQINIAQVCRNALDYEIRKKQGIAPTTTNPDELYKLIQDLQNEILEKQSINAHNELYIEQTHQTIKELTPKYEKAKQNQNWKDTYKQQLLQIKNETNPEVQRDYARSLAYTLKIIGIELTAKEVHDVAITTTEE